MYDFIIIDGVKKDKIQKIQTDTNVLVEMCVYMF